MAHSREIVKIRELIRQAGGTDPNHIMSREFGAPAAQLMLNGIPVYRNDYVSTNDMVNFYDVGGALAHKAVTAADASSITAAGGDLSAIVVDIAASHTPIAEMGRLVSIGGSSYFIADARFEVSAADDGTDVLTVTGIPYLDSVRGQSRAAATPAGVIARVNSEEELSLSATDFYVRVAERADGSRIYAGQFGEDLGVCGLTTERDAGIQLTDVGPAEKTNARIYRLCWYCSALLFNRLALACIKNIIPA